MTIINVKDVEDEEIVNCLEELEVPLIKEENFSAKEGDKDENGSIWMVLFSTAVAVCGSFLFGTCVGYSAPTQSAIREDLNLSLAQFSMFGSILTIGAMLGAITSGRIGDSIGRKGAMRLSACICITGWLGVYFSEEALLLDIGRLFTGYGIGVLSYVVPIFISEMAPKNLRGGLATANQLLIVIGSSVSYLVGSSVTWRMLALGGLIPCLFLLVGLFFVPESPRWLAKVGHQKEFLVVLRRLRGKNADISREAAEIQDNIRTIQALPKTRLLDLFESRHIHAVIVGVGLMIFQQFVGINGIGFYASEIFVSAGFSSKVGTSAYAILQIPITAVGALLMDRLGRRPLMMISATGTFFGCLMTGISFFLKDHSLLADRAPLLAVSGVLTYIASFSIGLGAVPWVIMSEIFPLHIKGAGGSLVTLVCWSGAWLISYTFNFLMSWSSSGTFFTYAGFSVLTVLFVVKFVPETKGKTLEEIQAYFNSNRLETEVLNR